MRVGPVLPRPLALPDDRTRPDPDVVARRKAARPAAVLTGFACATGALMACSDAAHTRALAAPDGRSSRVWAADAAVAALAPDGALHIAAHVPIAGAEIDPARAGALAVAYAHTFGGWLNIAWEQDRGGSIDVAQLQACGPAAYARSPHVDGAVKRGSLPEVVRRALAPQYLVELCASGTPVVNVAVSAIATDARVVGGRLVGFDPRDFTSYGINARMPHSVVRPEDAALLAAQATGQRVAEVPELVLPPFPGAPQLARWRITLEGPVKLRGRRSGVVRSTREVYAGFGRTWSETDVQIADPGATAVSVSVPAAANSGAPVTLQLPTAAGYSTAVESAEVVP